MPKPPPLAGLLLVLAIAPGVRARTLIAADGRSIEAEVLGFDGSEKVTIKRSDTGQTFTVRIDSFSENDQAALRAEAAEAEKKAKAIPATALQLTLDRVKLDTRREKQDIRLADGSTRREGITITEEDWGYAVTLRNTTMKPVEGLRGEYILFVKVDPVGGETSARPQAALRRDAGAITFGTVQGGGRASARTKPVVVRKTELADDLLWRGNDEARTRDTLQGVWLRVYQGDTLVTETVSPASLAATETWDGAKRR